MYENQNLLEINPDIKQVNKVWNSSKIPIDIGWFVCVNKNELKNIKNIKQVCKIQKIV